MQWLMEDLLWIISLEREKAANITLTLVLAGAIIILALVIFAAQLNIIPFLMSLINQCWHHERYCKI